MDATADDADVIPLVLACPIAERLRLLWAETKQDEERLRAILARRRADRRAKRTAELRQEMWADVSDLRRMIRGK